MNMQLNTMVTITEEVIIMLLMDTMVIMEILDTTPFIVSTMIQAMVGGTGTERKDWGREV